MNSLKVNSPCIPHSPQGAEHALPLGPLPGTPLLPKGKCREHSVRSILMAKMMDSDALRQLPQNGPL